MNREPDHAVVDRDPRFAIQLVDTTSGFTGVAQDKAYEHVHEKTRGIFKKEGLVKGLVKSVWYSNIGRDLIQHRQFRKATRDVRQSGGNYLSLNGGKQDDYDAEMGAVVERFAEGVSNEFLLDQGETNVGMGSINNRQMQGSILQEKLQKAIIEYAEIPSHDPNDGLEELKDQVEQFIKDHGPRMVSYGHNIFEVAKNARQARQHGEDVARINNAMTAHYGVARAGVRTGHQHELANVATSGRVARAAEFLNRNGLTMVNEATMGTALVVGLTAARVAMRSTVGTATRAATFGAAGGAIAGWRTYREEGRRQQHMRRLWAAGGKTPNPEDAPRLARMEDIKYDTVHASKLYDRLSAVIKDVNGSDPETVQDAINVIAEVQARRQISNELHIDLIQFASDKQIERERTLLYNRLNQAIEAVQRVYDNQNANQPHPARHGAAVLTPRGVETHAGHHGIGHLTRNVSGRQPTNIRTMVEARMHASRGGNRPSIYQELLNDINHRNWVARRRRLGKAAVIGLTAAAVGTGIGYGVAEAMDHFAGTEHLVTGALHEKILPGHGRTGIKLSDHIKMNYHKGFHSVIYDHGHRVAHHVGWDEQGNLADKTPAGIYHGLHSHGELVKQGLHSYIGSDGQQHQRYITEIWAKGDWHGVSQMPGALPLYFLRPLEKIEPGKPRRHIPETRLSTEVLASSYLKSFDKRTGEMIDDMAKRLKAPRNKDKTAEHPKAVITITADSSKDSRHIFSLLAQYARQEGIDTARELEIVVVVAKRSKRTTRLTEELERFQQGLNRHGNPVKARYRNLKVRVIEEVVPTDKRLPRRLEELAHGAVLSDLIERGVDLDGLVMLLNGADTKKVDRHYLETVLNRMNRVPSLDILAGQTGHQRGPDPARRPNYEPTRQRFNRMIERNTFRRPGFLGVSKANIAFRPRAYMTPDRRRFDFGSYEYNTEVGSMLK